jgi:hypothetical protein
MNIVIKARKMGSNVFRKENMYNTKTQILPFVNFILESLFTKSYFLWFSLKKIYNTKTQILPFVNFIRESFCIASKLGLISYQK